LKRAIILAAFAMTGCGDPIVPWSDKPAAWLEVGNFMGEWERVALIYGYWDDFEGCTDIANALAARYTREYRCVPTK
jgi:hypothetical protein